MSWIKALLMMMRFPAVRAEGDRVAVPALILPDMQGGLYFERNEPIVASDKRITLHFSGELVGTAVAGGPAGRPPFRP